MPYIQDLSSLINILSGGSSGSSETIFFHKSQRIGGAAAPAAISGRMMSLWQYDGYPSAGSAPTTLVYPDNTTTGGLLQSNPSVLGDTKFLIQAWATCVTPGTLILYDRLAHIGSLSGTDVNDQNVNAIPTRYTDGIGNIAFIEIYSTIGVNTTTVLMNYRDQDDNDADGPLATIGNTAYREQGRVILLPVNGGDKGIKRVNNIDLTATTGTAGNFGVVMAHPLAYIPIGATGAPGWRDYNSGLPGIPEIKEDACLALLFLPYTTTIPEIYGGITMVEVDAPVSRCCTAGVCSMTTEANCLLGGGTWSSTGNCTSPPCPV